MIGLSKGTSLTVNAISARTAALKNQKTDSARRTAIAWVSANEKLFASLPKSSAEDAEYAALSASPGSELKAVALKIFERRVNELTHLERDAYLQAAERKISDRMTYAVKPHEQPVLDKIRELKATRFVSVASLAAV